MTDDCNQVEKDRDGCKDALRSDGLFPVTGNKAEALEARADELVAYGNSLPDGVTTEAFAEAENLRAEARKLRHSTDAQSREACRVKLADAEMAMRHALVALENVGSTLDVRRDLHKAFAEYRNAAWEAHNRA